MKLKWRTDLNYRLRQQVWLHGKWGKAKPMHKRGEESRNEETRIDKKQYNFGERTTD